MTKNLEDIKDEDIDTSDIPEIIDWSNAVVGKFYIPKGAKKLYPKHSRKFDESSPVDSS